MDDRVAAAVADNVRWCDLVCTSHGIATIQWSTVWSTRRKAPPLYPDAITLVDDLTEVQLLGLVDLGPGCSVKDSFARLDLHPFGFTQLFEAHWVFREPGRPGTTAAQDWDSVHTINECANWVLAHGSSGSLVPQLLSDHDVQFLVVRDGAQIVAGAIASRSDGVVGISNVFSSRASFDPWAGLADAVALRFPSLPIVGYERGEDLEAATSSGFVAVGPLRVWQRLDTG